MLPAVFGALPTGDRKKRIEKSDYYRNGSFVNLEATEMLSPDASYLTMMRKFFFERPAGLEPANVLTSVKSDLRVDVTTPSIVWFGHSSYLMYIGGRRILVDPVFSEVASPFSSLGSKAFGVTQRYTVEDLPSIDLLILTHDHYDHLDYHTLKALQGRVGRIVTSLGVGAHLELWGYDSALISEFEWWESAEIFPGFRITATPARHFSGRFLKRNQSLWSSFVLEAPGVRVFVGGDSGYDASFRQIGKRMGPFDLAILECGQYDAQWPSIHMKPEETVQASLDLEATRLIPVHWGKFRLANHTWFEPPDRALVAADSLKQTLVTPMIGDLTPMLSGSTDRWWKEFS